MNLHVLQAALVSYCSLGMVLNSEGIFVSVKEEELRMSDGLSPLGEQQVLCVIVSLWALSEQFTNSFQCSLNCLTIWLLGTLEFSAEGDL